MADQPSIYSPEGDAASWVLDLASLRMAEHNCVPGRGDLAAAQRRMGAYGEEIRNHVLAGDRFGRRVLRAFRQREAMTGATSEQVVRRAHEWVQGMERRDASTALASLGTFTPPEYWLEKFAEYRSNAAPILAAATKAPLPATGMTVDVPAVQTGLGAALQPAENTSASYTTPSVTYATAAVGTYTSQQFVSQQVLDRVGPGIAYDEWHARQAAREIASAFETVVVASIVAGAQAVTDNASANFSCISLWADVAYASQLVIKAPPPALRPTHLFGGAGTLYGFMAQVDNDGRPIWAPQGNTQGGANNDDDEGWTGLQIMGSDVYLDDNLSGPSSGYAYLILGAPKAALLVLEADPVVDVFPETQAATLTASVNARQYAACSILYPTGFAAISGAFYPTAF